MSINEHVWNAFEFFSSNCSFRDEIFSTLTFDHRNRYVTALDMFFYWKKHAPMHKWSKNVLIPDRRIDSKFSLQTFFSFRKERESVDRSIHSILTWHPSIEHSHQRDSIMTAWATWVFSKWTMNWITFDNQMRRSHGSTNFDDQQLKAKSTFHAAQFKMKTIHYLWMTDKQQRQSFVMIVVSSFESVDKNILKNWAWVEGCSKSTQPVSTFSLAFLEVCRTERG